MKIWLCILGLVAFLANSAFAKTQLNGLAGYEHLNKEYYLAALYLPATNKDPGLILNDNRAQRMMVKVTASRWSLRKFTAFWREGFALNNDLSADPALTSQIAEFMRIPQATLTTGDLFDIQYNPSSGTTITFNGAQVMQADGKALFNAFLKTWIGEVPHSRLFQSQILGNEQDMGSLLSERIERFNNLTIAEGRNNLVAQWQAQEQAEQQAIAAAEEALKQEQADAEAAKKAAAAQQKKREQEKLAAQQAAEQAKKDAEQAKAKSDLAKVTAAIAAQEAAERKAAELAQALEAERQTEASQQIAVVYAQELYQWEVLRDVYKRVSYPEWARQFNQQGTVNVEFIVGSDGNLLGIAQVTPENSGLLGQELKDAVKRAAPFQAFPKALTQKQLKMKVSYKFTLSDRVAELPPPPVAPAGFEQDSSLTNVQRAVAWSQYKQDVNQQLLAAIEYPFWAKDLKQEGTVVADVLVLPDGSISKVTLVEKSRHAILNQEVEQAMGRLGSVAAFPSWVKDQTLTVRISHKFQL